MTEVTPQTPAAELPALLTPDEAAKWLRRTAKTVRRQLANGDLPGFKSGGYWLIPSHQLIAHLENSQS